MKPYVFTKIKINDLVREARKKLLESLISSQLKIKGLDLKLETSRTNWGGLRFWFKCPNCNTRCGVLLNTELGVKCNKCLLKTRLI